MPESKEVLNYGAYQNKIETKQSKLITQKPVFTPTESGYVGSKVNSDNSQKHIIQ